MRKLLVLVSASLLGISTSAVAQSISIHSGCGAPAGNYKYLFSDGNESYFFNDQYTVRIDRSGHKIIEKGDFNIQFAGGTYSRTGNNFSYRDFKGTYYSAGGNEIYFEPALPSLKASVGFLAPGSTHSDEFGTYKKLSSGKVLFMPAKRMNDIVLEQENCGTQKIEIGYDRQAYSKELGVTQEGEDLVVDLSNDILFDFDSDSISPSAEPTLIKLATLIRNERKGYVSVDGHTDALGTFSYNQNLSERRARSVSLWLQEHAAVDRSELLVRGYGEDYPVAANTLSDGSDNPAGRSKNRRVEVLIQTVKKDPAYLEKRVITRSQNAIRVSNANNSVDMRDGRISVKSGNGARVNMNGGRIVVDTGNGRRVEMDNGSDETGESLGAASAILRALGQ